MTVVYAILILSFVIFVHELGHFLAARRAGVRVEEFGFGFPPRITGKRVGKTLYSINWIPFGGFVRLKGEAGDHAEEGDSYAHKSAAARARIIVMGVVVNLALAVLFFIIGYIIGFPSVIDENALSASARVRDAQVNVIEVLEDSPAAKAGLMPGDVIEKAAGQPLERVSGLNAITRAHAGGEISLTLRRDAEEVSVTSAVAEIDGAPAIGVSVAATGLVSYPAYQAVWLGVEQAGVFSWQIIASFGNLIRDLVVSRTLSPDIAGPLGIAALTGRVASLGFAHLLQFVALLSLSLGVLNILPIPALDGGRLLFLVIEKTRGKAVSTRTEGIIHSVGFYLLLLLIIVVSVRDFGRFGIGESLTSFFQDIF